jgi:hypothetical protein
VVFLQLVKLRGGVFAGEGDVFVTGSELEKYELVKVCGWEVFGQRKTYLLGQIHLQTLRCGDHDLASSVHAEELGKDEAGRTGSEHEHGRTHLRGNLVETVGGAGGGLEKSSLNIGEVLDHKDLSGRVGAVFGKGTVHGDTVGLKVFAEKGLATTAVEALAAELLECLLASVGMSGGRIRVIPSCQQRLSLQP